MTTFNIQDQVVGGGVADEALGGEAPEVGLGVQLGGEADAASCHDHAATGTQAELLQQLGTEIVFFFHDGCQFLLFRPKSAFVLAVLPTLLRRYPFWYNQICSNSSVSSISWMRIILMSPRSPASDITSPECRFLRRKWTCFCSENKFWVQAG